MELYISRIAEKLKRHIILTVLFLLYVVAFWFLFFTKGIYVEGHFYRKSANLTQISYTSADSGADFEKIIMQKHIDKSVISADDKLTVTIYKNDTVSVSCDENCDVQLSDEQWLAIADQSAESYRGFGSKPWLLVLVVLAAAVFVKRYSPQVYSFFFRNKAANENYYKTVDIIFKVVLAAGLLYLIIPI